MSLTTISAKELFDRTQSGEAVDLIDVRTPLEYLEVHVPFARNIPLNQLEPSNVDAARKHSSQPLYVICRSGGRSRQAREKLLAAGSTNIIDVEGGTQAWVQAGLPVERGPKAMSLERQVRIAAGAIVFISSAMGAFVSPYWIGLAAFVGAGLVFAGITDTCGMGMLLARMPWNHPSASVPPESKASETCQSGTSKPCCH